MAKKKSPPVYNHKKWLLEQYKSTDNKDYLRELKKLGADAPKTMETFTRPGMSVQEPFINKTEKKFRKRTPKKLKGQLGKKNLKKIDYSKRLSRHQAKQGSLKLVPKKRERITKGVFSDARKNAVKAPYKPTLVLKNGIKPMKALAPPKVRRSRQLGRKSSKRPNWTTPIRQEATGRGVVKAPRKTHAYKDFNTPKKIGNTRIVGRVLPRTTIGHKKQPKITGSINAKSRVLKPKTPGLGSKINKIARKVPWGALGKVVQGVGAGYAAYNMFERMKKDSPYQKKIRRGKDMNKIYKSIDKHSGNYTSTKDPYKSLMGVKTKRLKNMSSKVGGNVDKVLTKADPKPGRTVFTPKQKDSFTFGYANKKIKLGPAPTLHKQGIKNAPQKPLEKKIKRKVVTKLILPKKTKYKGSSKKGGQKPAWKMPKWKGIQDGGGGIPREYSRSQIVKSPQYRSWKKQGWIKSGGKRTERGRLY